MPLKLKVSWKAKGPSATRMAKDWMADPKHNLHDPKDMDPEAPEDDSSSNSRPSGLKVKEMKVKIKAEIPASGRKRYKPVGEE